MAAPQPFLQPVVEQRPPSDASEFSFTNNQGLVLLLKNSLFLTEMIIWGDPADTMTSAGLNAAYANAPNNSLYITGDGATTKKIAIKFGTPGLTNGSFLFSAALAAV